MTEQIEILLSTIGNRIAQIPLTPCEFPDIHFLVIHQTEITSAPQNPFEETANVTVHRLIGQSGLSSSRNSAIEMAQGDICLLADDDVTYVPNLAAILASAFAKNPEADIITFQVGTPDGNPLKNYPKEKIGLTLRSVARVSSIEIAFRRSSILNARLRFDPLFGLGATYATGEEYIFLTDAIRRGLKVIHFPVRIATHPMESSGKKHDEKTVLARGAMMARVFGYTAFFLDIVFALKKYVYYKDTLSFTNYVSLLFLGSWEYIKKK